MAEVIRPKFDVIRGWAGGTFGGSAHDRTFDKVVDGAGAPTELKRGTFVTLHSSGGATVVTNATGDKKDNVAVWCIVEGNDPDDSYSGDFVDKVVAIRGSYEVLLSETMFTAGSYAPNDGVYFLAGKVTKVATTEPVMGTVLAYDAASKLLTVAFSL